MTGASVRAAAVLVFCLSGAAAPLLAQTPAPPAVPRTLVMPFEASTREPRSDWFGEAAAMALTGELRAIGVTAVGREDRLRAMQRLRVPNVPLLSHATVIRLSRAVGATQAVIGHIEASADEVVVRARPIRLDSGRLAPEVVERGPRAEFFAVIARVGRRLAPDAPPGSSSPVRPPLPAFELLVRGLLAPALPARIALLNQALQQSPTMNAARFALWDAYSEQGAHDRALGVVAVLPTAGPDGRRAAFLAAVSRVQLAQLPAAFENLSQLHRAAPDAALANDMGVVQLRRPAGAPGGKASAFFQAASTLDPSDPDLFFNLGYALWFERSFQPAITALREAVRRNPADDEAHYVLGAALLASGATEESAREKDLARRLSSEYAELEQKQPGNVVPRGLERLKVEIGVRASGRVESLIEAAEQRGQRDLASFHLGAGRRLYQGERDAEALAELQRAVYLSPYDAEAHLIIGRIHLRGGHPREAIDALKISVWSQDTPAGRLALADAYIAAREYAAARVELQAALAADPSSLEAKAKLAGLPPP